MEEKESVPTTIQEAIKRWRFWLDQLTDENSEEIAAHMVGAVIYSEDEQKWSETEPKFAEVFELVANLEWNNFVDPEFRLMEREEMWKRVKELLRELEEKYGH